jgi:DNA (cytosine-5)-methyltransferase 1
MPRTFASIFTGGGLADVGAWQAGCSPLWGVELKPEIAEVANQNLKHQVFCQSVLDTDFSKLEPPDILWASPPCPSFSTAKTNAKETQADIDLAESVVRAIDQLNPSTFLLENVAGYQKSKSFALIKGFLEISGYSLDVQVLNAADFGAPQSRKRLILRAVLEGEITPLPIAQPHQGWYQAIEDLIPDLPESEFAEWQLKLIPENWTTSLISTKQTIRNATVREQSDPSFAVTADWERRPCQTPKAFLVDGKANGKGSSVTVRHGDAPSPTITSSAHKQSSRAFLVSDQYTNFGSEQRLTVRDSDQPSYVITAAKSGGKAGLG